MMADQEEGAKLLGETFRKCLLKSLSGDFPNRATLGSGPVALLVKRERVEIAILSWPSHWDDKMSSKRWAGERIPITQQGCERKTCPHRYYRSQAVSRLHTAKPPESQSP
jgi:hypothetical protein